MKEIFYTNSFKRKLKKYLKNFPDMENLLSKVIKQLSIDINESFLKTHKLKGKFSHLHSSSLSYSHRIVYLVEDDRITLEAIGDHDSVY